jgi:molybdenum cofactor biosynthesis enzyme MoaA
VKTAQEVLEAYKERGLPQKFCSVPFTTLQLEPDGVVGGCRQKGTEFPMGSLNENSLMEIWNGPKIRQWRQEFLDGKPLICKTEVRHYQCHTCPEYNSLLPAAELSVWQEKKPSRIAFNLNGKCNLECQMCHVWQKPNGLYDKNGFWDWIPEFVPHLKEVELLSGEPFIQRDTYKLIDLISKKNPECRWIITTNANWKLTPEIKKKLDKIQIRNLIISLDSLVPETYAKIRKKGDLSRALATLRDLQSYEQDRLSRGLSGLQLKVNFLVQKLNWRELGSFYDFKISQGVEIFRSFLYEPSEHSLLSLSETERSAIVDYYRLNCTREQVAMRVILPLLDSLSPLIRAEFFEHLVTKREIIPQALTSVPEKRFCLNNEAQKAQAID